MDKKESKKISKKELERMIEEERHKLLNKKKKTINPKKKIKLPDKDISDKIKIKSKSKSENLQEKMDYHHFLQSQMEKLDYSSMFSYMGAGVNAVSYSYSEGDSTQMTALQRKYETMEWQEVKNVTNEEKMNQLMGFNRNYEMNDRRDSYKWWKVFNKGLGELLYQLSMT